MKIVELIKAKEDKGEVWWAFEYFPPRTDAGVANLYERMEKMARLST
jgi:methylenetetrahydrofolate reductase (NADPH)